MAEHPSGVALYYRRRLDDVTKWPSSLELDWSPTGVKYLRIYDGAWPRFMTGNPHSTCLLTLKISPFGSAFCCQSSVSGAARCKY